MGSLSPQAFTIISINFPQSLKSNPKVSFYNYLYSFRSRRKKYFKNSVKNAAFFDLCFEFKSIHEQSTRVSLFFDVSMSRVQCRRWDQISPRIRVACLWPNANVVHLLIPSYPPPSFLLSFVFPTAYRVQTTAPFMANGKRRSHDGGADTASLQLCIMSVQDLLLSRLFAPHQNWQIVLGVTVATIT